MPVPLTSSEYQDVVITTSQQSTVVVERRVISLAEQVTTIDFHNFPKQIASSSLHIQSITDPLNTFVVSQSKKEPIIKHKLINNVGALSERLVGQRVLIQSGEDCVSGYMVGFDSKTVIIRVMEETNETSLRVFQFSTHHPISLSIIDNNQETRDGESNYEYHFVTDMQTNQTGDHTVDVHYSTAGISSEISYHLEVNESDKTVKLVGNVLISNESGKDYHNAIVFVSFEKDKLITPYRSKQEKNNLSINFFSSKGGSGPQTLTKTQNRSIFPVDGKKISLANESQVQFTFFCGVFPLKCYYLLQTLESLPIDTIHIDDIYVTRNIQLIKVLSIENTKENHFGLFLPSGLCDIYVYSKSDHTPPPHHDLQNDDDDNSHDSKEREHKSHKSSSNEIEINETKKTDHHSADDHKLILKNWHTSRVFPTMPGEQLEIPISNSSSIKASKVKKSFKKDDRREVITESFQISITNNQETADIIVEDCMFRTNRWELSKITPANYYSVGNHHVRWEFPNFPLGDTQEIKYTVTYNWNEESSSPLANTSITESSSLPDDNKVIDDDHHKTASGGLFSKIFSKKPKK